VWNSVLFPKAFLPIVLVRKTKTTNCSYSKSRTKCYVHTRHIVFYILPYLIWHIKLCYEFHNNNGVLYILLHKHCSTDICTSYLWTYDLYGPVCNVFDLGHYLGHWKGWAMKVSTFLGPNSSYFARAVSGPKKSQLSWPNPSNGPCNAFACIKSITY